ncbi:helix-turn-helix domain-containing protein [Haloarculaceae archaeon H-GB2-1]|nr:helix-turn-helix domain-containing protein [Haloarculaceae archaeon H-GB1-1]MEA5406756.1 helix-turn-helix domain-containing protein [Haloarculaceae archaeon H-GB2-1]
MSLLPSKPDTSAAEESAPRVVGVDSEDADELLAALSSGTARRILSELHDEPVPPSKLAERVDTSLQNAQYHLENLEDAGAVEVVDTVYSEKGREMDVYAPADRPLVIYAGDEEESSSIRAALSRLLGGLGILALGSLAVQSWVGGGIVPPIAQTGSQSGGGAGGDGGAVAEATETATVTPTETATATSTPTPTDDAGVMVAEETQTTVEEATRTATEAATETSTAEPAATAAEAAAEATRTATEAATQAAEPTRTAVETTSGSAADLASAAGAGVPPGLLFFAGGAIVLVGGFVYWYARR